MYLVGQCKWIPFFYALMPNKREETYLALYRMVYFALLAHPEVIDLTQEILIMMDYEKE